MNKSPKVGKATKPRTVYEKAVRDFTETAQQLARLNQHFRQASFAEFEMLMGLDDEVLKRYGLPKAVSGHNQYGAWGPRGASGDVVVAIGFTKERLDRAFGDLQPSETISPAYALPEESGLTIYICRQPRKSLSSSWNEWTYLD